MYQYTDNYDFILNLDTGTTIYLPFGGPLVDAYNAWLAEGNTPLPGPAPEVVYLQSILQDAINSADLAEHAVKAKFYASVFDCCGYAGSSVADFAADAAVALAWRDAYRAWYFNSMNQIANLDEAGRRAFDKATYMATMPDWTTFGWVA